MTRWATGACCGRWTAARPTPTTARTGASRSGTPSTSGPPTGMTRSEEKAGGQLTTYSWDSENQLTSVASPDGTTESYGYFAEHLRAKKVNAGGTVLFVWDDQNLVLETDTSQVIQAHYSDWAGYWGGLA